MNVYKNYARSVYVLYRGGWEGATSLVLLNISYETITCLKSTINAIKQGVKLAQV